MAQFILSIKCDGAAFAGDCPGDLLGEVARILRRAASMVEAEEFDVPTCCNPPAPRALLDINGNRCGSAGFI